MFPNFCQKNNNIKQTLMVYKVPPGDIFANNYGRGHMKPSHQVSYDMRLPPNKKIPVKNDQYIQGTPWKLRPREVAEVARVQTKKKSIKNFEIGNF